LPASGAKEVALACRAVELLSTTSELALIDLQLADDELLPAAATANDELASAELWKDEMSVL